jgi:hypothetical protein
MPTEDKKRAELHPTSRLARRHGQSADVLTVACTGWQLEPVAGSVKTAMENRRAWRAAIADGRRPEVPEPRTRPVPTFEGGTIAFVISSNRQRDGYEIASLFPRPPVYDFPAR